MVLNLIESKKKKPKKPKKIKKNQKKLDFNSKIQFLMTSEKKKKFL